MARISKPRKSITTMWTDPHTGVQYTVQAQHALSAAEMREICVWTARLQDDLRSGAKQMITTPHDASAETPAYIMQGKVDAIMDNRSNLKGRAIGKYLDTVVRKMMQQPVQQQQSQARADRYAEFEWTPQATSLLADRFEHMPRVGDTFSITHPNGSPEQWRVEEVFSCFGETRIRARFMDLPVRTFERIARNKWRRWQDSTAPVFSL
jgi:hypothetical protein